MALSKNGKRMGRPPKPKPPEPPKEKRGKGRPLKLADDEKTLETISGLAKIQCTMEEAAAVLHVSKQTFLDFLGRYKKARDTWDFGQQEGKSSLRRAQLKCALNGNATMQIWLGKQMLGQKDKHEMTGADGAPLVPEAPSTRETARAILDIMREAGISGTAQPQ
jgi:hypothetical protein